MLLRKWNIVSLAVVLGMLAGIGAHADSPEYADESFATAEGVSDELPLVLAEGGESPLAAGSCQLIGGADQNLPLLQLQYRANVFRIQRTSELQEIRFALAFCGLADLSFSVHRSEVGLNQFVPVYVGPLVTVASTNCGACPCKAVFSSGTLALPVTLQPVILQEGFDYAIGVTWGATTVRVFRDVVTYPQDFSDGTVRGSVGFPFSPGPPLDDETTLRVAPFTGGAWEMQICLKPKAGACCLPGGVCNDQLTESACLQAGGKFTEETLTCADLAAPPPPGSPPLGCPLALGACCLGTICAPNVDLFSCEDQEGVWKRGEPCTAVTCLPTGACCLPDGFDGDNCLERSRVDCENPPSGPNAPPPGIYQGDNTTCAEVEPSCNLGACCTDTICLDVSRAACASVPGIWGGNGSDCAAGVCEPVGACCKGTTCTDDLRESECIATGGLYQGDWSLCSALPSPCGMGACCRASGCTNATRANCEGILNGEFQGEETSCQTLDPPCPGICCLDGECIDFAVPDACGQVDGIFVNYNQTCPFFTTDPDPCAPTGGFKSQGGCCLPDGTCVVVAGTATGTASGSAYFLCETRLFGSYLGDNTNCMNAMCPAPPLKGACCLFAGGCVQITEQQCERPDNPALAVGTYQNDMTTCSLQLCARGACCQPDGTCDDDLPIDACSAGDQSFFDGAACGGADVSCTVGACCFSSGPIPCAPLTERGCADQGGQYAGDGILCTALDVCTRGSCCIEDGSCLNDRIAASCAAVQGSFNVGMTCVQANCPPGGACCVNGQCRQLTAQACAGNGGFYRGNGQPCTTGLCPFGACCEPTGDCVDAPAFACGSADQTFRPGLPCSTAGVCPGSGACCVSGMGCVIRTLLGCQGLSGQFIGVASSCSPLNPCETGACCLDNGQCFDQQRSQCDNLGGELLPGEVCGTQPCPPARACCGAGDTCNLLTREACEATPGNVFLPDQLTCNSVVCDVGACCLEDGCCVPAVLEFECLAGLGGASFVRSTACVNAACAPVAARGACCTTGSCQLKTQSECTAGSGVYLGDDSVCVPGLCLTGGCCQYDGTCANGIVRAQCNALGGAFQTGISCGPGGQIQCPQLGACCESNVCTEGRTLANCTGVFGGPGSRCAADSCDVGACCLPTGTLGLASCQTITKLVCDDLNGYFRGAGTACVDGADPVCTTGSCCRANATCVQGGVAEQCDAFPGAFMAGVPCSSRSCAPRGACCPDFQGARGPCEVLEQGVCTGGIVQGLYIGTATTCEPTDLCEVGACCLPNDTCDDQNYSRYECGQEQGLFEGGGTLCGPGVCTLGACCLPNGTCEASTLLTECTITKGGVFHPGAVCTGGLCPAVGPCFLFGEGCQLLTQSACQNAGGAYGGNGLPCPTFSCIPGACHVGVTCIQVDESDCRALSGAFQGSGVLCPRGACCLAESCSNHSEEECDDFGGTYLGDGRDCFDDPCNEGACCLPEGTCADTTRADCAVRRGQFSDNLTCGTALCPPTGACCAAGGCQVLTHFGCTDINGSYEGNGSACTPDPCSTGACCKDDGTCVDTIEANCLTLGGSFNATATCAMTTCPPAGACCVAGACQTLTANACANQTGTYLGDAVACAADTCTSGACCKNDGSCTDTVALECTALGGAFSAGVNCASMPCPPAGACCGPTGCEILTQSACAATGTYLGDGSSCSPNPCATGACCTGTSCQLLTSTACVALPGGNYIGDDVPCTPSPCITGACCNTGMCEVFSEAECISAGGTPALGSATCSPDPCNLGACCVAGNCVDLSEAECLAATGVFQGGGVACVPGLCTAVLNIVSSNPSSGLIDARRPHLPADAASKQGFMVIFVTFDGDATGLTPADFSLEEVADGSNAVLGPFAGLPTIIDVSTVLGDDSTAKLDFDAPIDPRAWTVIQYLGSGQKVCIGFLPGDVNGSRTTNAQDITAIINHLNGVGVQGIERVDINRSGTANASDITALIDLLNGAGAFEPWLNARLPVSPCAP